MLVVTMVDTTLGPVGSSGGAHFFDSTKTLENVAENALQYPTSLQLELRMSSNTSRRLAFQSTLLTFSLLISEDFWVLISLFSAITLFLYPLTNVLKEKANIAFFFQHTHRRGTKTL